MAEQHQNLLIDLEALLDTRFGLIYQRYPKKFRKLQVGEFCERNHNRIWEYVDDTEKGWLQQWGKRDQATIESSRPTNLLINLKEIIASKYVVGKTSPLHSPLALFINTWPYRFDSAVLEEIVDAIREWTFPDVQIKAVFHAPETLTPELIKNTYQALFMYNWVGWMELHRDALMETKLPRVVFNIPSYIYDNDPKLLFAANQSTADPYQQIQRYLSEHLAIEWLSPNLFSLPSPSPS